MSLLTARKGTTLGLRFNESDFTDFHSSKVIIVFRFQNEVDECFWQHRGPLFNKLWKVTQGKSLTLYNFTIT